MQALVIIEAIGKAATWEKVLNDIGMKAAVVATHGYIAGFPSGLWPLGISFGEHSPCDPGRRLDPEKIGAIRQAAASIGAGAPIFIATDDDVEGDVIALDVIEGLLASDRSLSSRIFRARPQALSHDGIVAALDSAQPLRGTAGHILKAATPGRARAVSDRWIGAVFSREANHPVGRVRSAVLGCFFLLEKAPQVLRGRPDLGEIVLRCRSISGGQPFLAHFMLNGSEDLNRVARLKDIAERFRGRLVPGVVRPRESLSAAVAPRVGSVRPFNTGDALAYAARHFGLGAKQAMRGLQDAYMSGLISYPRTESREITRESAVRVVRLAEACRLNCLEVSTLCGEDGPSLAERVSPSPAERTGHEALHPVANLDRDQVARFEAILRTPIPYRDLSGSNPDQVRDIMAAIVARRAMEAAREVELELGDWRPDNSTAVLPEDAELLEDLEWVREDAPAFPWSKDLMTGCRQWPLRAVAIDMMMIEGIGRPSTYASHADIAEASGEIEIGDLTAPPRPSPFGRKVLARIPKGLWNPGTCRMIEIGLSNRDNICGEGDGDTLQMRIHRRVRFWLSNLPEEMRQMLLEALGEKADARESAFSGASPGQAAMTPSGPEASGAPPPLVS